MMIMKEKSVNKIDRKSIFCAKRTSLFAQLVSCIWIGAWSGMKFLSNPKEIDIFDVFLSGISMAGCFCPVYFSIFFDKIASLKEKKD